MRLQPETSATAQHNTHDRGTESTALSPGISAAVGTLEGLEKSCSTHRCSLLLQKFCNYSKKPQNHHSSRLTLPRELAGSWRGPCAVPAFGAAPRSCPRLQQVEEPRAEHQVCTAAKGRAGAALARMGAM